MKNNKRSSINIFTPATFAAGFYAGYKETSGADLSPSIEFLTKYAPTMFAIITTSGFPNFLSKRDKLSRKGIEEDTLTISKKDPIYGKNEIKKYSDSIPEDNFKVSTAVHKLERISEQLQENKLQKTFYATAITGTTTLLGYWLGSAFAMSRYMGS